MRTAPADPRTNRAAPLLEPGRRLVIGHRGAAGLAPENTLASFDLALSQGAEALELDVRQSADGVAVVHHDPTVDRTTNGQGEVRTHRWADLANLDAGANFSPDGRDRPFRARGIRIPALRDVLERYPETPLLIEVKVAEAQTAVREELVRAGAADRAVIASFDHQALRVFRRAPFLVGASRRDIVALKVGSWLGLPPWNRGVAAYAVPYRYRNRILVPTPALLRAAGRLGAPVHVWTVDDPAIALGLWQAGVAGIITNFPGRIRAALEGRSAPGS